MSGDGDVAVRIRRNRLEMIVTVAAISVGPARCSVFDTVLRDKRVGSTLRRDVPGAEVGGSAELPEVADHDRITSTDRHGLGQLEAGAAEIACPAERTVARPIAGYEDVEGAVPVDRSATEVSEVVEATHQYDATIVVDRDSAGVVVTCATNPFAPLAAA